MNGTCRGCGPGLVIRTVLVVACGLVTSAVLRADEPQRAGFLRMHVPQSRLEAVPLGTERHVPMAVEEFDALIARAAGPRAGMAPLRPTPMAERTHVLARFDEREGLVGTLSCTVSAATVAVSSALPLGGLLARSAAGPPGDEAAPGAAANETAGDPTPAENGVVFGGDGGSLFLATPTAGTFACGFACPPEGGAGRRFQLPLPPALATRIDLGLPPDVRPVILGSAAREAVLTPPVAAGAAWRIDLGSATAIGIELVGRDRPPPSLRSWSCVTIRHRDADVAVVVVPDARWQAGELALTKHADLVIAAIEAADAGVGSGAVAWRESAGGRDVVLTLPPWLEGTRQPLVIRGVAPAGDAVWRLPLLRCPAPRWAGGGMVVRLDPTLVAEAIELVDCRVVTPQATVRWPLACGPAGDVGTRAAVFHLEHQTAAAAAEFTVRPRTPSFDVARVTTVEISPAAVLGRAACDVRVVDGEAFEVAARIAPGWIIDSVEPLVLQDGGGRRPLPAVGLPLDWRTIRGPEGNTLRIGLPVAVTPTSLLGLRISGHRPRIPVGAAFKTAEIDMVRFPGESADSTLIDFKVGPEALVEVDGEPAGWLRARGRLAPLVEEGTLRARIRGSDQASNREARVVQRRPPLDARVEVRLDVRDDLLVQSFTFACQPEAGGVDALVTHFSEPMGEPLVWSVLAPANVAIAVRRLEAPGGLGGLQRDDAIAESWLIECTPAVSTQLVVRAVRTLPFIGAVPVPLAWLEGDTTPGGVVVLSATGPRPEFVSRRLRELPAAAGMGLREADGGERGEFAYGPPGAAGAGLSAAELVPAPSAAVARAWAWLERVSCWCDESGASETESLFDLENHGRSSLALTVPAGRILERVLVDGAGVPVDPTGLEGGSQRIPLPAAKRRVELLVRTRAAAEPRLGFWRVNPLGCSIDVPVLDRDIRLLVPPGLDVAGATGAFREVGRLVSDWPRRLFGPPWSKSSETYAKAAGAAEIGGTRPAAAAVQTGFHAHRFVVAAERAAGSGIVVVRRRLLGSLAILAAAAAAAGAFRAVPARPRLACGVCLAAAMAALWAAPPFDVVARVALWAAVGGVVAAVARPIPMWVGRRLAGRLPAWSATRAWLLPLACGASLSLTDAAAGDEPFRVVITAAAEGPLALVPEPFYRLLADATPPEWAGIRVLGCRIEAVEPPAAGGWRMILDIDADVGGSLVLDQTASGAAWRPAAAGAVPPGARVTLDGPRLRLSTAGAGRLRVVLGIDPNVVQSGALTTASVDVPTAPGTRLVVVDAAGRPLDPRPDELQCDAAAAGGPWRTATPAVGTDPGFDVAGARRVRIVRPVQRAGRLAGGVQRSANVNEVTWGLDSCRVDAFFEIDGGATIIRSVIARVDERFSAIEALAEDGDRPGLTRLSADRLLVEFPRPAAGITRLRLAGTMPVTDPVGAFTIPGLWPEGAADSECVVRLTAAPELEPLIDPAPIVSATAGPLPRRLDVRRRRQQPRGSQNLLIDVADDRTLLTLRVDIDATAVALTRIPVEIPAGCIVDRVALVQDDPALQPAEAPVDISWARTAADLLAVVVQQPRPGRFRLDVDVRLPEPLPPRGTLPVARAVLRSGVPLLVTWQAAAGLRLVVTAAGTDPATATAPAAEALRSTELLEGAAGPDYVLGMAGGEPAAQVAGPADAEAGRPPVTTSRLERTEVMIALDGRGRARGIVRFDVVTDQPVMRVRLPAGMRLFDVLVDGREAPAVPRGAGAWDVRLQDVDWPRALLVMFSGELGAGFAKGDPVRMEPPAIDGLASGPVWWMIEPPPGFALRIADPARPLTAAELGAERAAVRRRLDAIFDRALAATTTLERERLERLAAVRRVGASLLPEAAWEGSVRAAASSGGASPAAVAFVSEPADGGLTLRASRDVDPTAGGRTVATAVLLLAGGGLWLVGRRGKPGD